MTNRELFLFLLRVLVLFTFFLLVFYSVSPFLSLFLAKAVNAVVTELFPRFIHSVISKNGLLEVVTYFSVAGDPKSQLAFDINPLKYTYGFPLFLALTFATQGKISDRIWHVFIAYFIILLTQTWGISFDITRHLLFEFNGVYAAHFEFSAIGIFFISLGSQLGFLILPSLVPIILWVGLESRSLNRMIYNNDNLQDADNDALSVD